MTRTFEEFAGEEMDALYQGALFLAGGNTEGAQHLLVDAVTLAFREYSAAHASDTPRWFEARLVRSFLRHVGEEPLTLPESTVERVALDTGAFDSLGADDLVLAAAEIPAWPRAALWLVTLRRWSYCDAAAVMKVTAGEMENLLGYRDVLLGEVLRRVPGGRHQARSS